MSVQVFSHYQVEFIAADETTVVGAINQPTYPQATAVIDDCEQWPEHATFARIVTVYREGVYGKDYGKGSVKNRFGGARVPSGAHQFRG